MSPTRFPRNAARARRVAAAPLLATMALVAGCGGITLQSTWTESDVTVDGDLADWEGALQRLGDESASVGVRNDSRSIYIALATSDRMTQMQALTHGLTVWTGRSAFAIR
jgi:hypothetical protein